MKRYLFLSLAVFLILGGCAGMEKKIGPPVDYLKIAQDVSDTDVDADDNGAIDTVHGGLNRTTVITGVVKGDGTAYTAAVPGTDYVSPTGSGGTLTLIPLDSDFISNGLMKRTGAGAYGIGVAGTDYALPTRKLDDFGTPDDNTDLNASTTYHGLLPKLSNTVTEFLNGQGGWTVPAGGGDVSKVGTPANHEWGIYTGDGTLKGLAVTGSKVACTDADGEPVACTSLTDVDPMTAAEHTTAVGADNDTQAEINAKFAAKMAFADSFTMGKSIQEFGAADTTPDVSAAATGVNNIYRVNGNGQITDFDDGDGAAHDEFSPNDWFALIVDDATSGIKFYDNVAIEGNSAVNFTGSATQVRLLLFIYFDARWNEITLDGMSTPTSASFSEINMGVGPIRGAMGGITKAANYTMTAPEMNGIVTMTATGEITVLADQCDTATFQWLTVMQTGAFAVDISFADAADDAYLSDYTKVEGTTHELQTAGVAGNQVTIMCIAANTWKITGEIGTCTAEVAD